MIFQLHLCLLYFLPCAKAQAKYLKKLKKDLKEDEVIVLGDFAENYKFIVQDEIQGFHWNQTQCTLHPIMIYYKQGNDLFSYSICYISDDITHDVDMVNEVIKQTVDFIKKHIDRDISIIHYFSDGCAGQYKNCKNFLNLCKHFGDFSINCVWSFFATSHGKSPCDGLGGTIKRLTARASLQRPIKNQILTAMEVLEYCQKEVQGIISIYIYQRKR